MPLPPKERTIIPPKDGWKEHTYYHVLVAYSSSNIIHEAVFQVGFLGANSAPGEPGNYSEVWCNSYDRAKHFDDVHYLKVIQMLFTERGIHV